MKKIETVAVIGLGYIGLPTAAILAENGVRVHGVDVSDRTVDAVNAGTVPFVEPDLAGFVARGVEKGLLSASTTTPAAAEREFTTVSYTHLTLPTIYSV